MTYGLVGDPLDGLTIPSTEACVRAVALETDDAVDDIRIEFTSGERAMVQAKRRLHKMNSPRLSPSGSRRENPNVRNRLTDITNLVSARRGAAPPGCVRTSTTAVKPCEPLRVHAHPGNYDTACDLAGAALLRRVPAAATLLPITEDTVWSEFSTAVYIAADFENTIRDVGSTVRARTSRVGDRVQEHVVNERAARWTRLMVVPLTLETDEVLVGRIEGRIGAVLCPLDTVLLPVLG